MKKEFDRKRVEGFFDNIISGWVGSIIAWLAMSVIVPLLGKFFFGISIWAMVGVFCALILGILIFIIIRSWSQQKKCFNNIQNKFSITLNNKGQSESLYKNITFPDISNAQSEKCEIEELILKNKYNEIVADGGAGKTTLLQFIVYSCISGGWKQFKNGKKIPFYIALNRIADHQDEYFLATTICSDYIGNNHLGDMAYKDVVRFAKRNKKSTIVLLLDGFNELRDEKDRESVILEITKISEIANINIVLTSRSDAAGNIEKVDFVKYVLRGYTDDVIRQILSENNIPMPETESVLNVIRNPMMLSIYKEISLAGESTGSITNEGKLIQKYIAFQEEKRIGDNSKKHVFSKWLYRIVVPAIGFFMERDNVFSVNGQQLREYIIDAHAFARAIFITSNISALEDILDIDNQEFDEAVSITNEISDETIERIITNTIAIIIKTNTKTLVTGRNQSYGFYHQIYRDFFSAFHIYNEVVLDMPSSDLFLRVEPKVIATYFCQIAGENNTDGKITLEDSGQHIYELITKLSSISVDTDGYYIAVRNLLDFMIMAHGGLFGFNYSGLDLSYYSLNGVLLSYSQGNKTVSSRITDSTIDYLRFSPQGHLQWVLTIDKYDDQTVVSGGRDGMVKLWNIPLSYCEYTLKTDYSEIRKVKCDNNQIYAGTNNGYLLTIQVSKDNSLIITAEKQICDSAIEYILLGKREIIIGSKNGCIYSVDKADNMVALLFDFKKTIQDMKMNYSLEKVLVSISTEGLFELAIENKSTKRNTNICSEVNSFDNNTHDYDQEILTVANEQLELLQITTGKKTTMYHEGAVPTIAVFCDNYQKAVAAYNDNSVVLWNVQQVTEEKLYTHNDVVEDIIVLQEKGLIVSCSRDFSIIVYSMKLGEIIEVFSGESYWIRKVLLYEDDKVLIPSTDGSIKSLVYSTGDNITYYYDDEQRAYSLCLIDNNCVVSAKVDGSICLWDIKNHMLVNKRKDSAVCLDDVETLGNGRFIGVNSLNEVFLWKMENGKMVLLDTQRLGEAKERDIPGTAVNSIYLFENHNGRSIIVSLHWNNSIALWSCDNDKLTCLSTLLNIDDPESVIDDWPYCAVEVQFDETVELAVVSRKGNINLYSIINGVNATENHARGALIKNYPYSLYSAVWMNGNLLVSDAKGNIVIINKNGLNKNIEMHKSRIFLLKKVDDNHLLSYSEDGFVKYLELKETELNVIQTIPFVPGMYIKNCLLLNNIEKNTDMKDVVERYL